MSNIKDIDGENGEIDLLALLYPDEDLSEEFDGSEHGDIGEDLGDSHGGELDELLGLRSLFSAMPDEEPSDAVSNRLLALAATHAPKPAQAKSEGLWTWFSNLIMPLATHPGLAAAASLVLVAGVVGTLYYKNGGQAAEPLAKSAAQDPTMATASTPSLGASAIEESRKDSESPTGAAPEEKAQESEGAVELESDFDEIPVGTERTSDKRGSLSGLEQQFVGGKGESRQSPSKAKSPASAVMNDSIRPKTPAPAKRRERKASFSEDSNRDKAPQVQKKNKSLPVKSKPMADRSTADVSPAPPARGTKIADDGVGGDSDDSGEALDNQTSLDSKTVSTTKVSALHSQAKIAAKKGDCSAVLRLGRQIRKLDSAYYRRSFLSDTSLGSCQKK